MQTFVQWHIFVIKCCHQLSHSLLVFFSSKLYLHISIIHIRYFCHTFRDLDIAEGCVGIIRSDVVQEVGRQKVLIALCDAGVVVVEADGKSHWFSWVARCSFRYDVESVQGEAGRVGAARRGCRGNVQDIVVAGHVDGEFKGRPCRVEVKSGADVTL